ncbi:alpha/beta hydrolase [Phytobacter sp. V91]|uniref:alpha/beta hydrolase n=1 Tax=Phytobacter sp. V91 TaxID=3369425 RepID=UPI003F6221BC
MIFPGKKRCARYLLILSGLLICVYSLQIIAIGAFYHPNNKTYRQMPRLAESVIFTAKDGTRLHGWFIPSSVAPAQDAVATVIHAHGNAGNMSAHWPLVSWLPERNFNLFMFDYRGFGESEGAPTPQGLCDDTQSAIDYVRQRDDVDAQRLVLLGQSLGGNNVLAAAGRSDRSGIRAVILDSTFLSYSAIASQKIPGSGFLLDDSYSADRYISTISPVPVLLIHGTADRVIPWQHSEELFALAREPKQLIIIPDGEHIDAFTQKHGDRYRDAVVSFLQTALPAPPK